MRGTCSFRVSTDLQLCSEGAEQVVRELERELARGGLTAHEGSRLKTLALYRSTEACFV